MQPKYVYVKDYLIPQSVFYHNKIQFEDKFSTMIQAIGTQWIEYWPVDQKVASLGPRQGTCLGFRAGPQMGACERQLMDVPLTQ